MISGKRENTKKTIESINKLIDERPELAEIHAYRYVIWLSDRSALHLQLGHVDQAIADLETVTKIASEPALLLRMAELYQLRGRRDDYNEILKQARTASNRRWAIYSNQTNLLALGRLAEMQGENPKILLSSLYTSVMDNLPNFAPGFVAAGDLAYRKGAVDLAAQYYQKALNIDAVNEDALAGLAETYWKSGDPRLEKILESLQSIYPNNHRAIAIQVEQLLDLGDAKNAMELIDPVLQDKSQSTPFSSLESRRLFFAR